MSLVRICSIDNCDVKHLARGFCQKHYDKWKIYGNPLHVVDPEETSRKLSAVRKGKPGAWKGKKFTKEHKKKISESSKGKNLGKSYPGELNSFFGKTHTKKSKIIMSELKKEKAPWNKGKTGIYSQKTLDKMSLKAKIIQNRPDVKEANRSSHTNKKLSKDTIQKISNFQNRPDVKEANRKRLRQTRKKFTSPNNPEKKIIGILNDAKIKHQFQVDVEYTDVEKGRVSKSLDFLIKPNKIIEHNGPYDHAEPRDYKPDDLIRKHGKMVKASEIWKQEKIMLRQIRKEGYKILVIWQHDLYNDTENTTKKILKFASKT